MRQTMRDPCRDIRPREPGISLAAARDRQHHRHGIELRGLLEQVGEVVGLPAHGGGDDLVDLLASEGVLLGDVEARVHREARREHPAFDDESPGVEGDDWGEEGGGADGLHGCSGVGGVGSGGRGSGVSIGCWRCQLRVYGNIYCLETEVLLESVMMPDLVIAGVGCGAGAGCSSPRLTVILPRFVLVDILLVVIQRGNLISLGGLVHS